MIIVLRSKLKPKMNQIKTTIRDVTSEDTKALISLCEAIGLFQSHELEELGSMLSAYFKDSLNEQHRWLTEEKDCQLIGIAYYAKEKFAATRAFYRKNGYEEEARIREFYNPGEDKIIFRKALNF